MLKRLYAGICILGICVAFFAYNMDLAISDNPMPNTTVSTTTVPPAPKGQVRFVNPDPELQAAWERIATAYTEKTGIPVDIIPEKESAGIKPTLFTVADAQELENYANVCVDLAGTNATHHLDWSLTLYAGKKMCGLPAQAEGFGLIYNAELLRKAGQTPGDITSFGKLKEVAQHISTTSSLKFEPFAGMEEGGSALALLTGMPGDIRQFWDLYMGNSASGLVTEEGSNPTLELLEGKVAFCIGGTREYGLFSTMSENNLNILPLYIGMESEAKQGLCIRVDSYWCVRSDISKSDINATLDFLDYLLHPVEGVAPVDNLEVFTPYATAAYYSSPLEKTLREQIAAGKNLVVFSKIAAPEGVTEALAAYSADPTDENWAAVAAILA